MMVNGLLVLAGVGACAAWALVELRRLTRSYPGLLRADRRSAVDGRSR